MSEEFHCGFKPDDLVSIPKQHQFKNAVDRGTVYEVKPEVLTSLKGQPYQMVVVRNIRGRKETWPSTSLRKL